MNVSECHVAIIGAGPYGLSAAAHLRAAKIETRVFGIPLDFWRLHMPAGMKLRSPWQASHISDPAKAWTLDQFEAVHHIRLSQPIPLQDFVRYGEWFQRQAVPDVDTRLVTGVERNSKGFRLYDANSELVRAHRVVIATGIGRFANRPRLFESMPPELVSHTCDHCNLQVFAGKQVVVVGSGQSALETSVLLKEVGARVEVIARAPLIRWLGRGNWLRQLPKPLNYAFFPPSDVGPPGLNWLVALPDLFRRLPRQWQGPLAYRAIRPAVSGWVRPRARDLRFTLGRQIVSAVPQGEHACLTLDDGSERCVDHVLLATGYCVDIARLEFLTPALVRSVQQVGGYPVLAPGFESSVPGLHFVGASAAWSYGPLMRFVAGAGYAARGVTKRVAGG